MNKKEFLLELHHHLRDLPVEEINDIILDYQEFFYGGIQDGRSEKELIESLGDPKSIARQIKAEYMVKLARSTPTVKNLKNALMATLGRDFFKVLGLSFIISGILLLLNQFTKHGISFNVIWPILLTGLGLAFEVSYYANPMNGNANVGFLIPGGILSILGFLFFFCGIFGYSILVNFWPVFILAIALGLFQFYFYGYRIVWIFIPVFLLSVVGGLFLIKNLVNTTTFKAILAIFFIITGIFVGFKQNRVKINN